MFRSLVAMTGAGWSVVPVVVLGGLPGKSPSLRRFILRTGLGPDEKVWISGQLIGRMDQ
jgi:hypothetical protein